MASGTVVMSTQSVDYPGYTRGKITLTNNIGWNVNENGDISFSNQGSSDTAGGRWFICSSYANSGYGVYLEPQVNYGGGWISLAQIFQDVGQCGTSGEVNTIAMSNTLIGKLGTYHLTGDCQLRFLYYANRTPGPDAAYPNAFPDSNYSAAVQVPVHVDVSWNAGLQFDPNGGTGGPSNQSQSTSGDSYSFTVPSTAPTRKNFIFHGWSRTKKVCSGKTWYYASDAEIKAGDRVTVSKSSPSVTLYAVWEYTYRPGAVRVNGKWESCDRDANPINGKYSRKEGAVKIRRGGQWVELRTRKKQGSMPPNIKVSGKWQTQDLIGNNAACHDVSY